jgi:hypothetical protein
MSGFRGSGAKVTKSRDWAVGCFKEHPGGINVALNALGQQTSCISRSWNGKRRNRREIRLLLSPQAHFRAGDDQP